MELLVPWTCLRGKAESSGGVSRSDDTAAMHGRDRRKISRHYCRKMASALSQAMALTAYTSRTLYTPVESLDWPVVVVEDGAIATVGTRGGVEVPPQAKLCDFGDGILVPGFVDIHIHGSAGCDVMQADASGRRGFEQFLARHGVTSYYPTTIAAPLDVTERALERLADGIEGAARENSEHDHAGGGRAQPLGVHLEGPFLSHARCGAHRPEDLISPSVEIFDRFWQAARGHIRLMTIAPELGGAPEVIAEAAKRGVCVSLGHSDADLGSTRRGVAAGARHATHTFNAVRPLRHRDPGIVGEVLTNPHLTADIIVDGLHVDPTVVKLFLNAKGTENAVLITDATSATGMPDGKYQLGTLEVEVKDGKVVRDGKLAGSVLTMDRAVRNAMKFAGWDLQQAVRMASANPARVAGAQNKGVLQSGAGADFVVLSPGGEVRATVIRGKLVE
jgi:N-acetylglucosamine-6-phosphate deacetylase